MSNPEEPKNSSFGPDYSDGGRKPGDWQTRYSDPVAIKAIRWERNYLIIVLTFALISPLVIGVISNACVNYLPCEFSSLKKYLFGWFGGVLGGTIFSMKWLYHSVAKNIWNIDRKLWRLFTPHLSGALALIIIILINSGTLNLTDPKFLGFHKCFGIGFLVGYFSDNAIGKLTEIANVFFGNNRK